MADWVGTLQAVRALAASGEPAELLTRQLDFVGEAMDQAMQNFEGDRQKEKAANFSNKGCKGEGKAASNKGMPVLPRD